MVPQQRLPLIEPDKRGLICGRTGSGKTTLAAWLLARSYQHWVILNPKHTALYRQLPYSIVYNKFEPRGMLRDLRTKKFVILELTGAEADADYMDGIIGWLHGAQKNLGLMCDELYTLHASAGRAGPGLIGWLTRGREHRQSFLGLTQRPVWLTRFAWTETEYICEMDLTLPEDRDTVYQNTGQRAFLNRITGHRWLWYDALRNTLDLYSPVPSVITSERAYG
jgi:hypothetical protein